MGCVNSLHKKPEVVAPRVQIGRRINRTTYGNSHVGFRPVVPMGRDYALLSLASRDVRGPDLSQKDVLGVEDVDFNIQANTAAHHTAEYDITDPEEVAHPKLVIRRGQPFDITITFNRPYDKSKDDLKLVFQAGDRPAPSKNTHVEIILSDRDEPRMWGAKIRNQSGNKMTMTVFTPPTCFVAMWNFKLDVVKRRDDKHTIFRYNHEDPIYMLFNPWCKDDCVFMDGDKERDEYVMNETGRIYSGSCKNLTHKPWNFGQFQGKVLDACMYILEEAGMNWAVRGNPVPVVRKITAAVNSPDDYGVLTGNWSGHYDDGVSPLSWTGSVKILEQYLQTKEPVSYGQCWVFSGITTTVCRALGIPSRSVTNFASAHDTDGSITIDVHFDENGEADDAMNCDSVWNFHVWNEAWMARPDLPSGYGGWQAMDATPQETSDGVYCCGPVPVLAIKRGEVNLPFDGQFVFAEVNADKVYWTVHPGGSCDRCYIDKGGVGKNISTKAIGKSDREDVTCRYKFPEGSEEERVAVVKANQVGSIRHDVYDKGATRDDARKKEQDVKFELSHTENNFVGQNFDIILKMRNMSNAPRSVKGRICGKTMYYTGVVGEKVKADSFEANLKPGQSYDQVLTIGVSDYEGKLKDMCMLQLTAMARVTETKQIFTNMCDFRLRKPHLEIKAPKEGRVGSKFTADISFTNPLAETLTGCTVQVDGPGLQTPLTIRQGTVNPKQTFMTSIDFVPRKRGNREIIILFTSKQLDDINGTHTVSVRPK